jgi:prepilin-type N-terminal cleavage/methylation domain-containing protein/prepilin-type processing-associated H-X9-DG protein
MRRCSRAFTLVELLVVISIIGILISILLPALGQARRAACATACLAHVRSLQIASFQYSDEHNGRLIEPGLPHGGLANEEVAWLNTLRDYGTDLIVHSPCDESPHWPADEGGQGVPVDGSEDLFRRTSYGVNNLITRYLPVDVDFDAGPGAAANQYYNRMQKIVRPTHTVQFLLMAETGSFAGADHPHVEDWTFYGQIIYDDPTGRDRGAANQVKIGAYGGEAAGPTGRSNYGFLDGHASMMRFDEVYESAERNRFDPRLQD